LIGHDEAVHEAGTGGLEAERGTAADAELLLDETGDVRKDQIRCRGAYEDQIDIGRRNPRVFHGDEASLGCEIARRFVVGGNVATLDARPTANPLVGRLDHLFEIRIGEDLLRQVLTGADNARVH
jgi:hypothetical protein